MVEVARTTDRKFGCEIEFVGTSAVRSAIVEQLSQRGIDCRIEGYNHNTRPHWKIVSDASCGWEMVSPILQGEDGMQQLNVVCEVLTDLVHVNRQTGVHVHLDASDLKAGDVKTVVSRYRDNETEIDTWFPRSRRGSANNYCRPVSQAFSGENLEGVEDDASAVEVAFTQHTRFCKVNTRSLNSHGTIEFRQHAGSTDFSKIGNWVLFLQHFVEQSRKIKESSSGVVMSARGNRKRWYGEVRDEIERLGGTVSYQRWNKAWRLEGTRNTLFLNNDEMITLYDESSASRETHKTRGRVVGFSSYYASVVGALFGVESEEVDESLTAEVPDSVVEFFNQRAAALAA